MKNVLKVSVAMFAIIGAVAIAPLTASIAAATPICDVAPASSAAIDRTHDTNLCSNIACNQFTDCTAACGDIAFCNASTGHCRFN